MNWERRYMRCRKEGRKGTKAEGKNRKCMKEERRCCKEERKDRKRGGKAVLTRIQKVQEISKKCRS
jgi:hypothetical protein